MKTYFGFATTTFTPLIRDCLNSGDTTSIIRLMNRYQVPIPEYHQALDFLVAGFVRHGPPSLDPKGLETIKQGLRQVTDQFKQRTYENGVKILAKSIMNQAKKEGYTSIQIIQLATELIGLVTIGMEKKGE